MKIRYLLFVFFLIAPDHIIAQVIEAGEDLGIRVVERRPGEEPTSKALIEARKKGTSIVLGAKEEEVEELVPVTYKVEEGDTLWSICERFFNDPYKWPELWSYNPEITNPHWIYPGQIIRLRPLVPEELVEKKVKKPPRAVRKGPILVLPEEILPPKTIFLRNYGFVDKEILEKSGVIVGSKEETQYLMAFDEAYVEFKESYNPRPGDIYTIYRDIRDVYDPEDDDIFIGKMVEFLGLVKILTFNPETHIAKVLITESLKPIERGYKIASIQRTYAFIPPVRNEVNLVGKIVAFLEPVNVIGDKTIVFVDKGYDDGVRIGNRFFVIRKRDMWRESRGEPDDNPNYPYEIIGELRVVEIRAHTSTCWVTFANTDIRVGDKVEMRRGY